MLSHRELMTQIDIRPVILPVSLDAAANSGIWVPVRNFARIAFVYFADVGTASQDVTLTARQATDGSGTGAKNLVAISKVYSKESTTALPSNFTVINQTAAATWVSLTGGESNELAVWELDPALMDVANGFDWVTIDIADPGAGTGKTGCVLAIGLRARYASDLPSAAA